MRIKMLETKDGANEGHTVTTYKKGDVYEVTDDLGNSFVGAKAAKETDEDTTAEVQAAEEAEKKAAEEKATEKAAKKAPENKDASNSRHSK